jgi:hypothetical protein
LCELLVEELLPLLQGKIGIEIRDIDTDEDWRKAYDVRIPVVEFEGQVVCQYHLDRARIEAIVAAGAAPGDS